MSKLRKYYFLGMLLILSLIQNLIFGQSVLSGVIKKYTNQNLYIFKNSLNINTVLKDTLIFIDSIKTNEKGEFVFLNKSKYTADGMYKVFLKKEQFFYVLLNNQQTKIETVFYPVYGKNIATDSLKVIASNENKLFYEFMRLQNNLQTAINLHIKILRVFPLTDPFHKKIEADYNDRYKAMEMFFDKKVKPNSYLMSAKIARAYYTPINPDWKQPDQWRDSIIEANYFKYFNPSDSFYLNTNILIEKMSDYLTISTNKRDKYNRPISTDSMFADAAIKFINQTKLNSENFNFCLNFCLKIFNKQHKDEAFLILHDYYFKNKDRDCGSNENNSFSWAKKIADLQRNLLVGNYAPDFVIKKDSFRLSSIKTDYTLLVFWASWCPHCTTELPLIKQMIEDYNQKNRTSKITVVAISLDKDEKEWTNYLRANNLTSWVNYCELLGWKSEVVKKYNIYATPTLMLLDKNKMIIFKPSVLSELKAQLTANVPIKNNSTN